MSASLYLPLYTLLFAVPLTCGSHGSEYTTQLLRVRQTPACA